jgi:5-methylthioadenosine/S-adenosylhomocysteine deaminase
VLRLPAGVVARGRLADLAAIDLGHLSLQPRTDLLRSVVYAMSPQAVTDVWVHGRRVVADGRLATLSEPDLVARVGALTKGWAL